MGGGRLREVVALGGSTVVACGVYAVCRMNRVEIHFGEWLRDQEEIYQTRLTSFVVEIFFVYFKTIIMSYCLYFSAFFVFSDEIAFSSSLRILSGRHFFPPRRKISAWSDAYTYHIWRACFAHMLWWLSQSSSRTALSVACVAWRFCRAERTSSEAARKIKTACPDSCPFQLPPPSTHFDIMLTTCLVSVCPAN